MIFIENEKYSDPLTSVFGRTLQGRVGPMKKGKKTKKAKRRKMSKLSQVSLKDTVEKDGHCGQEKRQKYKTKRLFKLSQVSFRKDTAEKGEGHTGRGSCPFLPVSLFTHLGCFYTYHQTYDCKSIFKKSSISL